jgi:SNF2 family DNA or RNA helicase
MDPDGKCTAAWNAGKIPMMLVQPASAGAGLNLQHGGHILVVFDMFFSNELYTQLVGRLARQGQKDLVLVYLLMAVGTVDEIARVAVIDKEAGQQLLFKLLQDIREAVARGDEISDYDFDDAYDELLTDDLNL